ncbi:hypothetical protein [Allomesorhizobium alhagi]|uniref:Uncharacterized protein n=1 Tax=Mesorhizobium alhagi CCNWXJ12-2 TaxID=1107882 RepID=H0HQS0_9HYPH|nr:hypothetical protein [Mesorhizobium alhagi]EHK56884.1 hypothetical protein MAXJ12_12502 [Mesorhizobium alhagi CCNWXJ12-2]
MATMRAKMRISSITPYPPTPEGTPTQETLKFHAVAKDGPYPSDGSDEDNSYARYSPCGELSLTVANPALIGKFAVGEKFYLDFTKIE